MPNELIMNLSTVYMNCKKGTTTVWDAEQVEKAIELLNAMNMYGVLVCTKNCSAFKENEKYFFYNERGYLYIIINGKSYNVDHYINGTYRINDLNAGLNWEDAEFREVGECQFQKN